MHFPMHPLDRYFSEHPISGGDISLIGAEAHHLIHVMRGKVGTRLIVFDGRGGEWLAEISRVERGRAELTILGHQAVEREVPFVLTVASPLPKGDRQKWLVEKLVELGVTRFVPIRTARSVTQPVDSAIARLGRIVIESSKQCGRNRLMEIAHPEDWHDWVRRTQGFSARLVAHPIDRGGTPGFNATDLRSLGILRVESVVVAVGPEGGFTEEEIAAATTAGWVQVDLGPRILRMETAAMVMATLAINYFRGLEPTEQGASRVIT